MRNIRRGFPQSDESVTYVNGTGLAIAVGAVVTLLNGFGIATVAIAAAAGSTGTVAVKGEFSLTKATGYTLAQGQACTWDGTKVVAWTPASATQRMGIVVDAADTNAVLVNVRLEPLTSRRFATSYTVLSGDAAANSTNGRVDFNTGFGVAPTATSVVVKTATTGVTKSGFVISYPTPGTVRVDGVAASTQIDVNDVIDIIAEL